MQLKKRTNDEIEQLRQTMYPVAPPGEYEATCEDATEGVSKTSGNQMLTLSLVTYLDDGTAVKYRDYLVDTDGGFPKLNAAIQAFGLGQVYADGELFPDQFQGKTCRVKLKVEEYQGRESNKVDRYLGPVEKPVPAATPAAKPNGKGKVKKAVAPVPNEDESEDEIPF